MVLKKKTKGKYKTNEDDYISLVERTYILEDDPLFPFLDNLCFLSKNVYNSTLYILRQAYFNKEPIPTYSEIDKNYRTAKNVDYLALPQKVSQHSEQLAVNAFKSFFGNLNSKKKSGDTRVIKLPNYLNTESGRQTVFYSSQAVSTKNLEKDGYYTLSKVVDEEGKLIKFKTSIKESIQFVRIAHLGNHISIEVGYRKCVKRNRIEKRIASIDLGVDNIVTLTTNFDSPIIFNGKPIKYINHEYNSQIAKNQSSNAKCNGIKDNKWTKHMKKIAFRRKCKLTDYFHKLSRIIVNYLVSNHVTDLIIGKNDGWKQNTSMGSKNNQNFVCIPFNMLISMLEYKCVIEGIRVHTICESHTSKCSFLDNEDICHHDNYVGKRKNRDLFYSANGMCINADVNGSYNIMRRWCIENKKECLLKFAKHEVCKNPKVITLKLNGKKCDIGDYMK